MNNDESQIEAGAAGAPEGAVGVAPTPDEVGAMYKELGIKATPPTGAAKGRPKSAKVRAEDVSADNDANSESGRQNQKSSGSKSKNASADGQDGASGDDSDAKGAKVGKTDGKVQDESKELGEGVHKAKSRAEKDSKPGGEGDVEQGADGAGQGADDADDSQEEDDDTEEGKRPGKSNPKVEQRFQKLTTDIHEKDEYIAKLEQDLQEATQKQVEAKVAQEDPEYTIDDFRKVRDNSTGEIIDLDPEAAELQWRRWKDGFEGRKAEREAAVQHAAAQEKAQGEMAEKIMRTSVEAYDTLTGLMDEYPELVSTSGKFDANFAAKAMPIIHEALIYQPGTEPGNAEGIKPVVMGLKLNPKMILEAMRGIQVEKRSLPLNGVNDNVETRSNVSVPHSRSSDPNVNAANELYASLGIDKRV